MASHEHKPAFSILDYIFFGSTLLISASIGIFYAIRAWKKKEGVDAFLTGSRRMPLLPTSLSLLVSFVSGISIISYPVQVYSYGLVFLWVAVGAALAPIITGILIVPVLYRIRDSVSIYAYFEYRFGSKFLRTYGSILYQASALAYISIVLYAPSIALAGVTDLDLRLLIVSVGLICTLYTSIGGIKAVVWSDAFQAVVMYTGLLALVIQGTLAAGGFRNVVDAAVSSGRLSSLTNIDPNPIQYMTVWTGLFGGLFFWLTAFGSDQSALQRYYSLPSIKKARIAAFLNMPAILFIMLLVIYIGLTMIPKYVACDPTLTDWRLQNDQLVIFYMMETLGGIYGLPGLFLACIFSGTLSSVSSGLNSLSATVLEDFVKPAMRKRRLTDRRATLVTKLTGAFYGLIAMGLAFAVGPMGGVFKAVQSACGAAGGAVVGMFLLGILFPCSNKKGALAGTIVSSAVILWIFIGCTLQGVTYPPLPSNTDGCATGNNTRVPLSNRSHDLYEPQLHGITQIYAISYIMYSCISACLTVITGVTVSLVTGGNGKAPENRRYTYWESLDVRSAGVAVVVSKDEASSVGIL